MKHSSTQKTKRWRDTNVITQHHFILFLSQKSFFSIPSYSIVSDRAFNYTWTPTKRELWQRVVDNAARDGEIVCTEACPAAHGIVTSRYVFPAQTAKTGSH
ncbi:hypothetical protein CEXT_706221 [Caerostris extrusa]|uniref:Uncharacterized protein n=1 Tax=Caerostris extrusa TaxID=172846 RepID=A0AAV4XE00_CAEEX|nr:hypothetical protein CEXT_706221 [Caerostris extrusa]